ncbi:MAG: lytic transglycosylase domain-containing protein, partial [Bradyrhizobium sp.]|nr:lytic transglycosylase domain-containing protein [Bradyrhizobium sp.]
MAKKPIIQIDVNDDAFKRFYDLFQQYQAKVEELPDDWKKIDEAMSGAGKSFVRSASDTQELLAGMAAMSATIAEAVSHAVKAQRQFSAETNRSHQSMLKLGTAARGVASTVFGMGKWLLKWGAIGGGLAGIGSTIGLDDLAYAAMSRQRSARGVGMSPGQQAAFSTYFNQFGNADSVASNIASARNDVSKRWIFSSLGIGSGALANDSNFQLSIAAEQRAAQLVKSMPRATWLSQSRAMGLTSIFDEQTLRVLRNTPSGDISSAAAGARGSVGALGFSPGVARQWTDLQIQMRKAGTQIESSLITGLHKLAPELTVISRDIADWIQAFANSGNAQKAVDAVASGLKSLGDYLISPQFKSDMHDLGDGISYVIRKIREAANWFGGGNSQYDALAKAYTMPGQAMPPNAGSVAASKMAMAGSPAVQARARQIQSIAEKHYGLPPGILWNLSGVESSHGRDQIGPMTKYGRALGWYQLLPGTAKELGVDPLKFGGENSATAGAAKYLRVLYDHFGSWDKAVAAYNWGPGNLDAD